jgi:hypothetical protein
MAWTAPSTWVAGAILTAAQLNTQLRDNLLAGGPIYGTEALRDAAIPTPFEGQRAYITGSTIAAATGAVNTVPTGIQTVHNGSSTPSYAANWVCVTPVGAYSNTLATSTSTSYVSTLTSDSTPISATLTTGTTALISISGLTNNTSTGVTNSLSFAVSGATTLNAADAQGSFVSEATISYSYGISRTYILSGLTAGTNTFTLYYKTSGGTASWYNRNLVVQGVA